MRATLALLLCTIGFTGCYKLQSDEEIRKDIVGTWGGDNCSFPYVSDLDIDYPFPGGKVVFRSDGSFVQDNYDYNVCRDSCGLDSVSTSGVYNYCNCTWAIENGTITILSDTSMHLGYFNFPFPIVKIDDDCLILDKVFFNGHQVEENMCFQRF